MEDKPCRSSRRTCLGSVAAGAAALAARTALAQPTTQPSQSCLDELTIRLRQRMIDPRTEPSLQFNPRLPDVSYSTGGESSFSLSDGSPLDYNGQSHTL